MTLPEYIEQTRTTDLVNTVRHAALGLISEVGEVYGVLAKIERGDSIDRAERMTGELGDVAWYLARLTDLFGHAMILEHQPWLENRSREEVSGQLIQLGANALTHPNKPPSHYQLTCMWSRWARLCQIENLDPATVLAANLAKLRDRAARKVLQGDGDHR